MVMLDQDFQKKNYDFKFVRQEFLGEVRCIVMDVQPKGNDGGRFVGRIWVEDREYNIVRFNGTYSPHSRYSYYLHFDSWRLNLQAGLWLPSYVFIEESNFKGVGPLLPGLHFKAQTRLWSYDPEPLKHNEEFADIQIDCRPGSDRCRQGSRPGRGAAHVGTHRRRQCARSSAESRTARTPGRCGQDSADRGQQSDRHQQSRNHS